MSKREAINRYSLIIQRLRKTPATFNEISEFLATESEIQEYNFSVSKRTLKRDLEDIFSLYKIDIQYDFSKKVYQIIESDYSNLNSRMLEAFDTFNALRPNQDISKYIHFEKRRPQGTAHFYGILHAIQNNVLLSFTYHKFWNDEFTKRLIMPYALKEFKGRWYVLGNDQKDSQIKTFGLDRIINLEITKKKFKYPINYNLDEFYKNSFGIISPNGINPDNIILSFDAEQGRYLKSFPLHASQKLIKDNNEELRLSVDVHLTHDFIMEILSYGNRVEVIAPSKLRNQIREVHLKALNQYN